MLRCYNAAYSIEWHISKPCLSVYVFCKCCCFAAPTIIRWRTKILNKTRHQNTVRDCRDDFWKICTKTKLIMLWNKSLIAHIFFHLFKVTCYWPKLHNKFFSKFQDLLIKGKKKNFKIQNKLWAKGCLRGSIYLHKVTLDFW